MGIIWNQLLSFLTDKNPCARRGAGEHLPALVSGFPPSSASQESGLTPENLPFSHFKEKRILSPKGQVMASIFGTCLREAGAGVSNRFPFFA